MDPAGLWAHNSILYVADTRSDRVHACQLSAGASYGTEVAGQSFDLAASNQLSRGLVVRHTGVALVADHAYERFHAYAVAASGIDVGERFSVSDVQLERVYSYPRGAWTDDDTL